MLTMLGIILGVVVSVGLLVFIFDRNSSSPLESLGIDGDFLGGLPYLVLFIGIIIVVGVIIVGIPDIVEGVLDWLRSIDEEAPKGVAKFIGIVFVTGLLLWIQKRGNIGPGARPDRRSKARREAERKAVVKENERREVRALIILLVVALPAYIMIIIEWLLE